MTPEEINNLRTDCSNLVELIRHSVMIMNPGFNWTIRVPENAGPYELIRLLNRIEVLTVNAITRYLQRQINFEESLAEQPAIINRVLQLDRYLYQLHELFDEHIIWMMNHESQANIQQLLQNLNKHVMIYPTRDRNIENRQLLPVIHNHFLVHCYRAVCFGLMQEELLLRLSGGLSHEKVLALNIVRSEAIAGLAIKPNNVDNSSALQTVQGNPSIATNVELAELNQILEEALCDTQLTLTHYTRLNQLRQNLGSDSNMEFVIPHTPMENMALVQNLEDYELGLAQAQRRLFAGSIFIRRDRQIGYYSFHIFLMHELIHVTHIAQGLAASQINRIVPLDKWRGSDSDAPGFTVATEEFKTTFFDDISEYRIAQEMGIEVRRIPYVVFMLPLGKIQAYTNWSAIEEMASPLAEHMLLKGFLPQSRQAYCNLM